MAPTGVVKSERLEIQHKEMLYSKPPEIFVCASHKAHSRKGFCVSQCLHMSERQDDWSGL